MEIKLSDVPALENMLRAFHKATFNDMTGEEVLALAQAFERTIDLKTRLAVKPEIKKEVVRVPTKRHK